MFKKKYLGYFLLVIGGIIGAMTILINVISRGQLPLLAFFLVSSLGSVVIGSTLAFTQLLDRMVKPIVVDLDESVADDIEDIKAKRFTNAHFMFLCTAILALIFLFFYLKLHKFEAAWGGIPVIIPTAMVVLVGALVILTTRWFHDQDLHTPLKIYLIPVAGFILSLVLGLQTENPQALSLQVPEQVIYNDFTPVVFDVTGRSFLSIIFDGGSGCDDDGCLVLILIMALIVVTLVMVLGAASIPHFWIMSGMVFVAILVIITVHEIRIHPPGKKARQTASVIS